MKKGGLILLLLLLVPLVASLEFEMSEEFKQGETVITKISGNFLEPILEENIFFYRAHNKIPLNYDLINIEGEYYLYFQLSDKEPANYSINITGAKYYQGINPVEEDIIKKFTIINETTDFSVNPGFVSTKENFFLEVQNFQNSKIIVDIKLPEDSDETEDFFTSLFSTSEGTGEEVDVLSGEIKKINFILGELNESILTEVELSSGDTSYTIPIYLIQNSTKEDLNQIKEYEFEPSQFKTINISTNSSTTRILNLKNTGTMTMYNITLDVADSLRDFVTLSLTEIEELEANETVKLEAYIYSGNESQKIEGHIKAKDYQNYYAYSMLNLNVLEGYIPSPEENITDGKIIPPAVSKTCEEREGTICGDGEECSEDPVTARDGSCCLAECKKIEEEGGGSGKWIGWGIVILVVLFVLWFLKFKYKRARRPLDLFQIAKGKRKF
jgi:hypothetical protein